ncbi:MAG TPA: hypothetical protein VFS68_06955, partial [Candidatus Udaeobacter sp.]|nr:hypothetical protein [Candidatus Udaeobacter sp.]
CNYPLVIIQCAFRPKAANDPERFHLLTTNFLSIKLCRNTLRFLLVLPPATSAKHLMDPYAKPKERNIGARRPKIRHLSQSVEPRTQRERQAEKQEVVAERRAIKKAARRHLKEQLLRELDERE